MMVPGPFEIPRFFRWVFEDLNFRAVFDDLDFRAGLDCVILIPRIYDKIRDYHAL